MIKINNISVFLKAILILLGVIYVCFDVFHYFYPGNYCAPLSRNVIENSKEDIKYSRRCVMTWLCEIAEEKSIVITQWWEKQKNFICIRKIPAWVWRW